MRILLIITIAATLFYSMTGVVYEEGGFMGAFVIKPYPMRVVAVGGGEAGNWARLHPGQPPPWFMQEDLKVVSRFSWEEGGDPAWITAYFIGYLATFLAWLILVVIGAVKLIKAFGRRHKDNLSIKVDA